MFYLHKVLFILDSGRANTLPPVERQDVHDMASYSFNAARIHDQTIECLEC